MLCYIYWILIKLHCRVVLILKENLLSSYIHIFKVTQLPLLPAMPSRAVGGDISDACKLKTITNYL